MISWGAWSRTPRSRLDTHDHSSRLVLRLLVNHVLDNRAGLHDQGAVVHLEESRDLGVLLHAPQEIIRRARVVRVGDRHAVLLVAAAGVHVIAARRLSVPA